uniref:Uncharacterized protein n=1 Tax=Aureoumbra lagunensis TaxID=44058 RepID=A0A7S3NME4_9STRA|mmetsp:Transcript_745/g.950  ORF Transcript_745/g.950 Transcript_745/m.950 type:complete len:157 (+) Transcript_745:112-582(+)
MDSFVPERRASTLRVQCWRAQTEQDWRRLMGENVYISEVSGSISVAVRLAVEVNSFDPVLHALNITISDPQYEAWWTDAAPYPIRSINPTPKPDQFLPDTNASFKVEFIDGVRTSVKRVAPSLPPASWESLEYIPIGTWCRSLRSRISAPWGVITD